jgi:signal transduction histidine kinase
VAFAADTLPDPSERAERRRARERHALRGLGAVLLVIVLVPSLQIDPRPGLSGRGLAVAIAGLAIVTTFATILATADRFARGMHPPEQTIALLAALGAAGAVLDGVQPHGSGELTLTLVAWIAGSRLSRRVSIAITAVVAIAMTLVMAIAGSRPATDISTTLLISLLLLLMAWLFRRAEDERERAEEVASQLRAAQAREAEAAALAERSRIARELHDVLAHSLSGLALQLEGARLLAARDGASRKLQSAIDRSRQLAEEGLREARGAVGALRGDDLPGVGELDALVSTWSDDHGVPVAFAVQGARRELPAEVGLVLYRAAQESLTNAARHGRPERADVVLCFEPDGARLVVADHATASALAEPGPLADAGSGYGLSAMRERAEQLGGTMQAGPTVDGFRVEIAVPG